MRATAIESPAVAPPETPEERDRWRTSLAEFLAKRERRDRLRAELAEARTAGKATRHANRVRPTQRGDTTP